MLPGMADDPPVPTPDADPQAAHLPALPAGPSAAGQAALAEAQRLARQATAPATLRAYRADWQHFADWCARAGFVPVPAEPAVVGAYLASLADSHAPSTIRRRLAALGKMHRFNDLPWNPAHRDIQEPLRGVLRSRGRPARKAAALTLVMLRRLLATCDSTARGRRDRALLLFGFAGALRRSELVALQVEDVAVLAGGLRLRLARSGITISSANLTTHRLPRHIGGEVASVRTPFRRARTQPALGVPPAYRDVGFSAARSGENSPGDDTCNAMAIRHTRRSSIPRLQRLP